MINLTREEAQPEQMTSSSIAHARVVAGLLRERNTRTWDDIDRETVFAIDALVSFASTLLNHRLNSVRAQPEPMIDGWPLYSGLPQRKWVGLTDAEYEAMAEQYVTNCYFDTLKYAKAIEAKLRDKNS
jgi:hypothetical protein